MNTLQQQVKNRILEVEYMGDETPQDSASFLQRNLTYLAHMTNGVCKAPDRNQVLAWLQTNNPTEGRAEDIYLTFTEHMATIASAFNDICAIVRPSVQIAIEKVGSVGSDSDFGSVDIDAQVRARATQFINKVCSEILAEVEPAGVGGR